MIYTFYSFKGGVGRSMAVANLGECFHEKGLRVLLVDWDLEAPGLESYFYSPEGPPGKLESVRKHRGLLDMLLRQKEEFPDSSVDVRGSQEKVDREPREELDHDSAALAAAQTVQKALQEGPNVPAFLRKSGVRTRRDTRVFDSLETFLHQLYEAVSLSSETAGFPRQIQDSPLRAYLQCIHGPESGRENGLYLMNAGARGDQDFGTYASAVQEFDWGEFYATCEGRPYFNWLRDELQKIADVVLIDSRTGVTEMGGVCTRQMADAVVSFCAPNFQNVDGVVRVIAGLNKESVKKVRNERAVDVLVIPTRIDNAESALLGEFSNRFADKVEKDAVLPVAFRDLKRPLWNLQVPYIPRYNYQESLVIGPTATKPDPATQQLVDAYKRIAAHLAVLTPAPRIRAAYSAESAQYFPDSSRHSAPNQAPQPPENWVPRLTETAQLKDALLRGAFSPGTSKVALCGPAGIGKTALAASLCHDQEIVNGFPDGIAWITFDKFWTKSDLLDFLRTTFGIGSLTGEAALLKELADKKFLLVMDDVWDLRDVDEITRFGNRCTQLLLTRNSGIAASFATQNILSVGPLTDEQSRTLLKAIPQPMVFDDQRADLAQVLQKLPLGAALMRTAFERALAQQQTREQAFAYIRHALLLHGLTAFDNPSATDRSSSLFRSLQQSLSRISPKERKALVIVTKADKGFGLSDEETRFLAAFRKLAAGEPLIDDEKKALSLLAPEPRPSTSEAGSPSMPIEDAARASLKRLSELGLARTDPPGGQIRTELLIQEYLISQGDLGGVKSQKSRAPRVSSSDDRRENPDVQRANAILRGESTALEEMQVLAERLQDSRYFGLARRLFRNARLHPDAAKLTRAKRLRLVQRHALCTYRDLELTAQRYDAALAILHEGDLSEDTPSQETLGLAGAIFKNRWKQSGRRHDLEHSFSYYERGWRQPLQGDFGYTGINAAFVLDLLASMEREDATDAAEAKIGEARSIREKIASGLPPIAASKENAWLQRQWWYFATLAEACFGAARYEEARFWLREGLALEPPDWQLESTARQLAALAYAQEPILLEDSEAWRTLRVIAGDAVSALRGIEMGKVGIALSGGGFRASLFHIGVLARLAELDVLRHIEVLSCVSGGSIVGAHYYLEVRNLLQSKPDPEITREDYIAIVARIEREFLAAVQKNLRARLFANPGPNLLSLVVPGYTRTKRLGTLYEKHIYHRVQDGGPYPRYLEDLRVSPAGWDGHFNPKLDNWRRSAKVPILLLNATALNTGHNWQFSVSWMGEPPAADSNSVDRNEILRRMYYWEAPVKYRRRKLRLGHAVAASSCVPALFDPIEFSGLYPERTVRLVDGGVYDNQGIAGLLEQECSVVLVSDASGQMNSEEHPSSEISSVPLRTNSILMARVREAEALQLDALKNASALNGLMFLHMKQDLDAPNVDWVDCQDPYEPLIGAASTSTLTSYGIPRTVQQHLAGLRTDLDSFTDREAYALMLSGYRMADKNFRECLPQFPAGAGTSGKWSFLQIEPLLSRKEGRELEYAQLAKMLKVGASRGFKIWKLWPLMGFLGVSGLVAAGYFIYQFLGHHPLQSIGIRPVFATIGSIIAAVWLFNVFIRSRKSFTVIATGLLLGTVGWLAALLHLLVFDPLFLLNGSILKTGSSRVVRSFLPLLFTILFVVTGMLAFKRFYPSPSDQTDKKASTRVSAEHAQVARDYRTASKLWTKLLEKKLSDREALESRAYDEMQLGAYEPAASDYSNALQLGADVNLLRGRAFAYEKLHRLDESRNDLAAALKSGPDMQIENDVRFVDDLIAQSHGKPIKWRPLLYVHFSDPSQELLLKPLWGKLTCYVLPDPGESSVPKTELLYSFPGNVHTANMLAKELEGLGLPIARVAPAKQRTNTSRFDLWLAAHAKLEATAQIHSDK